MPLPSWVTLGLLLDFCEPACPPWYPPCRTVVGLSSVLGTLWALDEWGCYNYPSWRGAVQGIQPDLYLAWKEGGPRRQSVAASPGA